MSWFFIGKIKEKRKMFTKLFEVLRENKDGVVTPEFMENIGFRNTWGDCWYSDDFDSVYVRMDDFKGDTFDMVRNILSENLENEQERAAEMLAGQDW